MFKRLQKGPKRNRLESGGQNERKKKEETSGEINRGIYRKSQKSSLEKQVNWNVLMDLENRESCQHLVFRYLLIISL